MDKEKIFELEFEYISTLLAQTIEDRYRFLNFYIAISTLVASVVVGLSSIENPPFEILAVFTFGMFIIGIVFLLMMIRIRQAWFESAKALNNIKRAFIPAKSKLDKFFDYKNESLPKIDRFWNIHFYSTLLIILINTSYLVISFWFILNRGTEITIFIISVLVFMFSCFIQVFYYKYALQKGI